MQKSNRKFVIDFNKLGIQLEEPEPIVDKNATSCFYFAVRHYRFWAANYLYYKYLNECLPELVIFNADKDQSM